MSGKIYLTGSLRNPGLVNIAKQIQVLLPGVEVFLEWYAASPDSDDCWKKVEQELGYSYVEALSRPQAQNIFKFDLKHLESSDGLILVLPAGRSAHLEAGFMVGRDKFVGILMDADYDAERWDVMYNFATIVSKNLAQICEVYREKDYDF